MADLDSRLLNADQENEAAGKLRDERKGRTSETEATSQEDGEALSLRQKILKARQALDLKAKAKGKLEETVMAPAKRGTNWLLRAAWLNIIDSFGLTLIWLNLHVFLRWVLGDKLFCKLGEEWLPKQVFEAGGQAGERGMKIISIVEIMVLLMIDLIALCVLLAFFALIVMIVDFMQANIWEEIMMVIGGLTGFGWSGLNALYDLFAK